MKKLSVVLMGTVIISTVVPSMTMPASALGGCGPNRHRDPWGYCVWGGQNQSWCLRYKGHYATPMPDGTLRCF